MTAPATNRVLAHTGARYPIIQAPMGWIARTQLASAVSRAGGLGIIETSSGETANCQAEITKMSALGLPFGVNLPIRFLKDDAMLRFVCASGVKFVTTSAGSPAKFIAPLKDAGITVYHAVPTVDAALKCVDAGIDGLVVEGGEGGGFKNPEEVSTLVLLQAIRARVDVPLVAAGGICDGRGMAAAFALGAEAVQMGGCRHLDVPTGEWLAARIAFAMHFGVGRKGLLVEARGNRQRHHHTSDFEGRCCLGNPLRCRSGRIVPRDRHLAREAGWRGPKRSNS